MLLKLTLSGQLLLAAAISSAPTQPNIIFIMSDDLGIGEVNAYRTSPPPNNRTIATPNLDRLFQSGVRMLNAYTGEAVCAPSRAALLLGRHTGHTFSRGNYPFEGHDLPIPANSTTVVEVLKGAGYSTALVGKWGLGWWNTTGAPWRVGYDYYFGQLDQSYCHNMYPAGSVDGNELGVWEYGRLFPGQPFVNLTHHTYSGNTNASRDFCMSPEGQDTCVWTHQLWTDKAVSILTQQAQAGPSTPPLFMFLSYTDPHAGGWKGEAESGNPVPSDGTYANTAWPDVEKDHASVITHYQDVDVGRILDTVLSNPSLAANTLILFASDNGAHDEGGHEVEFFDSNGPYRGWKRSLYEGGIHTPMAAVWPGVIPANTTSNAVTAFWDVLPTLAQVAGVSPSALPSDLDGVSVLNAWTGQGPVPTPQDKPLYYEFCTCINAQTGLPCGPGSGSGSTINAAWQSAVRVRDNSVGWKALRLTYTGAWQLYNLTADPYETTDLASQYPTVVQQLAALAKAQHEDNPYFPVDPCTPS